MISPPASADRLVQAECFTPVFPVILSSLTGRALKVGHDFGRYRSLEQSETTMISSKSVRIVKLCAILQF